ncbi:unnamed protein product [Prunus brigantina]
MPRVTKGRGGGPFADSGCPMKAIRPHSSQRFYSQPTIRLSTPRIMAVDCGCEGQSRPSNCSMVG